MCNTSYFQNVLFIGKIKKFEIFNSMLFISGKEDKMLSWDKQFNQLTISDDQIGLEFTSNKWLQIYRKDSAVVEKPPLTATRWHHFKGTVQKHEVEAFCMENIGYCCEDVFDFIVKCKNMTSLLVYDIQDSNSNSSIVTGLTKALPRLKKLKEIDIRDVNMGSEGSVISSDYSPDLRILILTRTGLSQAGSSLTSALYRFPHLSFLDLFNSGLTKDESLSVLNTLPSSCPNIVCLSICPAKFTSDETKPVFQLKKLICLCINFETIEDWLRALCQYPQPLEIIRLYGNPSIGNELDKFISVISSNLRYLVVGKDVLNYEGLSRVREVMASNKGKLVVHKKDSQGWKEYKDQISKLRDDCMSS